MLKQKKNLLFVILSSFIIFFVSLKLADLFLQKKFGLGKPLIYENSRLYGYKLKPNQDLTRRGNKININNLGMRSSRDWINNSENKIIFFGDSVSFGGSVVSNKDLFSEKICNQLNRIQENFLCGNLAVNGYNLYSIIRSIKYKNFNNEDLIVITLIGNNFTRMFHNPLSQPFWTSDIHNFFPAITEVLFIYLDKFRLKKYKLNEEKVLKKLDQIYYNDLLSELDEILIKNNKPYLIFYSPTINEVENREINQYFRKILSKNFNNFYDLSEIKYSHKNELYIDEIHLSKKGHEIYSKYIYSLVKNFFN
tara:strand:- start:2381 stop:3304 length:924 start_codon:yes stop_codon:yes gene_type:complete